MATLMMMISLQMRSFSLNQVSDFHIHGNDGRGSRRVSIRFTLNIITCIMIGDDWTITWLKNQFTSLSKNPNFNISSSSWCKGLQGVVIDCGFFGLRVPPYFGCDRELISESPAYLQRSCFCICVHICFVFVYLCICLYLYLYRPPPYFGWDRKLISESSAYLQRWRPWQAPYMAWLSH